MAAKPTLSDQIEKLKASYYGDLKKQEEDLSKKLEAVQGQIADKDKEFAKAMREAGFVQKGEVAPRGRASTSNKKTENAAKEQRQAEKAKVMVEVLKGKSMSKTELKAACDVEFAARSIKRQGFTMKALERLLEISKSEIEVKGSTVKLAKAK